MPADESHALTTEDRVEAVTAQTGIPTEAPSYRRFSPRSTWLVDWATKGSLAVSDQALFAGAQFALNIMLARWLDPEEYGAFAVAYAVFLLVGAVHTAVLIEPMIVFGAAKYFANRKHYLCVVLRGHWLLAVPAGLILLGAGLFIARFYSRPVGQGLCGLALALPFVLLSWLTRRAFYMELKPGRAAAGGVVFFCALLTAVCWLRVMHALSPVSAILAMGVAGLLSAAVQLLWLRPRLFPAPDTLSSGEVASEHWGYGRWALAGVLPSWTLLNFYYLVLPVWIGLKEAGELKAVMNLAMPAIHTLIAFGVLLIPLLVRHLELGGPSLMQRTVRRVTAIFVAGSGAYLMALWIFRVQIMGLLYGGRYLKFSGLPVLLVGLTSVATALTVSFGGALRALERPDRVFWANVAASVIAVSFGLLWVATWGVLGAAAGYLASYAVFAGALWLFYHKLRTSRDRGADGLSADRSP